MLREAAERLRTALRPYDLRGRLGGEEFLAVLDCRDCGEAMGLAERLRLGICATPFPTAAGALVVTTTVGVTTWHGTEPSSQALLAAVDRAPYRAKSGGRNRVELERSCDDKADSPEKPTEIQSLG